MPFIIPPIIEFDFIANTATNPVPRSSMVTAIILNKTSLASVLVFKIIKAINFKPPQYMEANGYKNTMPRNVLFHFSNNFWVFGSTQAAMAIGEEIAKTGIIPARKTKAIKPAIKPKMAGTMNTSSNNKPTFASIPAAALHAAFPANIPPPITIPPAIMSVMIVPQPTSLGSTAGARSDMK